MEELEGIGLDLDRGLASLTFAVSHAERTLQECLRANFMQVTSAACSNAAFFVSCLNNARARAASEQAWMASRSARSMDTPSRSRSRVRHSARSVQAKAPRIRIGILGCGRLGRQLVSVLVGYAKVEYFDLMLSVRWLENVEDLESQGAFCTTDSEAAVNDADVIFLCCLPIHLPILSKSVSLKIRAHREKSRKS